MADIKESLKELLEKDPVIKNATDKITQDDVLTKDIVTKILNMIVKRVEDENDSYTIKHGFMTLSKCMNYLTQALCKDYDEFQNEMSAAHKNVIEKVMPALGNKDDSTDIEDFSLRRLMLTSGGIIDYVFWRDALGDFIQRTEEETSETDVIQEQSIAN